MKEKIYDEQILPLMAQIFEICKENKIALLADFRLDDDLHCISALLDDEYEPSDAQIESLEILRCRRRGRATAIAETIETKPDGSKHITISFL